MQEPVQHSLFSWLVQSCGLFGMLVMLSSVFVFITAVMVVVASRRPALIAACFSWLLLPLWLGCIAALWGSTQSFMVIAASEVAPKPKDVAAGVTMTLVCPLLALVLTFPSYLVLTLGLILRTLSAGKQPMP